MSVKMSAPLARRAAASIAAAALLAGCTIPTAADNPTTSVAASTTAKATPAAEQEPEPTLPLTGRVVFLDPGHSGYTTAAASDQVPTGRGGTKNCQTTGTSTDGGYPEHTAVFEIAELVRADLQAQGATVVLSRDDDASPELCNNFRAEAADHAQADAVVSLHADGAGPDQFGTYTSYSAPPLNDAQSGPAINLATDLRDAFTASGFTPAAYSGQDGLMARDDLTGLNMSLRPTALLELGNMRNAEDSRMLTTPEGQARLAQAVALGISNYLQSV
ncbi:N-acetylmuramoyl-L-alanine amidase [Tomitella biformata]|uniref:N-acetylmuramoyl-L-alanine amidase n=2 Tax=Tomitella biformata TaxID=630403 RepID=UPI0004AEEC5C|nr:N-acetylmuramoyl-L-alanine amidase [Tomitella biformata]